MSTSIKTAALLIVFIFSQSCANYHLQYAKEAENWDEVSPPSEAPVHTVYLIGDAGGGRGPAIDLLEERVRQESIPSTVVFLGDNVYPDGLGPKGAFDRELDEERLRAQLDAVKEFEGGIYFIAGNHDWYRYGLDGVRRQKDFIEDYLGREDVLLPKPGCGEPEEIELTDNLTLILIDSQWFLTDWDKEYKVNAGCEVKSRAVFEEYMEEAIKGNRNKNILIAMHHPLYTNGSHGGNFTARQHLFPLTDFNKKLYVPLPILGTGIQFLRGSVGHNQDVIHPRYRDLADIVIGAARKNGSFVIAAGHEHSLQYFENDEQAFIVSGAGSKQSPSKLGNNAEFAYGNQGFAQLDYYADGSHWVKYWAAYFGDTPGKIVYQKQVKGPLPDIVEEPPASFEAIPKQTLTPLSEQKFNKGPLWNTFWGEHYRKAYDTPVEVPTLNLASFEGGVKPVKRGGGYQTNSLRLEAKDGRQYVMRSVEKDATRTIGYPFRASIVTKVLEDNFSAAHPLAAMSVAALAEKIGIYHTQPKLYYVPAQAALGVYNEDFANALYLVEERPDDDHWQEADHFGYPDDIESTSSVVEKIQEEHDEQIDYAWVAKSRIFDILIGDWDRHDDQWRWAEFKGEEIDTYRPIPRDRDQAFSKYDGPILSLAKGTSPDIKKLLNYKSKTGRIKWLVYNGRHFDRTFLSGASWEDWEKAVQEIQTALTDEVVESAFRDQWPAALYALDGPDLIAKVKARRDALMEDARDYYELLAKSVDVVGTAKRDLFLVERNSKEGSTRVRVYDTNSKGEREMLFYDRTFYPGETKEIVLYGLQDNDIFEVEGDAKGKNIKLRMVGGLGQERLVDGSGGSDIHFYDAVEEASLIDKRSKARIHFKDDINYNTYNRESKDYDFNFFSFLPILNFNPDDRLLLGGSTSYTTFGFKKTPFATRQYLEIAYAPATGGFTTEYGVELIDALGNWELGLDANMQLPLYAINYYGFGNDTEDPQVTGEEELTFNRVNQQLVQIFPAIMRRLNAHSRLSIGPTYEYIEIEAVEGRFISQPEVRAELGDEVYEGIHFGGARLLLDFQNTDHANIPTRGVGFLLDGGWKQQLNGSGKNFAFLNTALTFYQYLDPRRRLTLASRIGYQHRFSEDYEFYQAASLGGPGPNANFRGFRRDRFIGTTAFWQNTDLRWKVLTSQNLTIPFSVGLLAGFDHGRVWYEAEGGESDTWHYSYGGGFWISPFDVFALNVSVFRGNNLQNRVIVGGNFFF